MTATPDTAPPGEDVGERRPPTEPPAGEAPEAGASREAPREAAGGGGGGEAQDDVLPRRSRRSVLITVAVAGAVLGAFLLLLVGAKQPDARSTVVGKLAPSADRAFATIDSVQAADRVRLADLRGRYVVLNFFASWCRPCEREHPELVRFQQRHAAAGDATVVQVLYSDKPSAARQFFRDRGQGGWPVLIDEQGQFALDYGVTGPPETFLIDPGGNVLAGVKSAIDEAGLEDLLTRAKQGRP